MNAKRFLCVSVGILCLVIAYSIGARTAEADFDGAARPIVGAVTLGYRMVLRADGTCWRGGAGILPSGWEQVAYPALPVPIDRIRFWNFDHLITVDGYLWEFDPNGTFSWARTPQPIPSGTVQALGKSMSDVKETYRR